MQAQRLDEHLLGFVEAPVAIENLAELTSHLSFLSEVIRAQTQIECMTQVVHRWTGRQGITRRQSGAAWSRSVPLRVERDERPHLIFGYWSAWVLVVDPCVWVFHEREVVAGDVDLLDVLAELSEPRQSLRGECASTQIEVWWWLLEHLNERIRVM